MVGFSMGKESSFPWWESLITAIDLIYFYMDDPYLLPANGLKLFVGYSVTKMVTPHLN